MSSTSSTVENVSSLKDEASEEEDVSDSGDAASTASSESEPEITPFPFYQRFSFLPPHVQPPNNEKVRLKHFIDSLGTPNQREAMMIIKLDMTLWNNHCNLKSDLEDIVIREAVLGMAYMFWDSIGYEGKLRGIKILRGVVTKSSRLLGSWHPTTLNAMDFLAISLASSGEYKEATWIWMDLVTETKSWSASEELVEIEKLLGRKWIDILAKQVEGNLDPILLLKNKATYSQMKNVIEEATVKLGSEHKMVKMFIRTLNSTSLTFLVGKHGNVDKRKGIFDWIFEIVDKPWWYNRPGEAVKEYFYPYYTYD